MTVTQMHKQGTKTAKKVTKRAAVAQQQPRSQLNRAGNSDSSASSTLTISLKKSCVVLKAINEQVLILTRCTTGSSMLRKG
jgi:hypothetical protein